MPRVRDPNREKAFEIYKECKGNIDLVKIAEKLGVSDGTIRGWKSKDKWNDKLNLNGTFQKEIKKIRNVPKEKKKTKVKKRIIANEVKEVLENEELNDRQRLFCIYYIRCFNATKAYQKAYGCSYNTANNNGPELLVKTCIRNEIARLKEGKLNRALLSEDDLFQKYLDIAFMDMSDFMEFGQKEMPMLNPINGEQLIDDKGNLMTYTVDYAHFKDSTQVDGSLISEISKGKDGAKIKLHDKMKAMQWLSEHMDLLTTETKAKLKLEEQKIEIAKLKAGDNEDNEYQDDGFMDALKTEVAEVWTNDKKNN
jgi:phage terminase small subunit